VVGAIVAGEVGGEVAGQLEVDAVLVAAGRQLDLHHRAGGVAEPGLVDPRLDDRDDRVGAEVVDEVVLVDAQQAADDHRRERLEVDAGLVGGVDEGGGFVVGLAGLAAVVVVVGGGVVGVGGGLIRGGRAGGAWWWRRRCRRRRIRRRRSSRRRPA
jgi:hypothetical protein